MNTELLKKKMGDIFENVSTEDLIKQYEAMGYKFIDTKKIPQSNPQTEIPDENKGNTILPEQKSNI